MTIKTLVKDALVKRQDQKYNAELLKKQETYDRWIAAREEKREPVYLKSHVELVYLCCSRGFVDKSSEAFFEMYFIEHPGTKIAYCDEDVWDETRHDPWFKPAWSPDMLDCGFYFGSLVAVRSSIWEDFILRHGTLKELFKADEENKRLFHLNNNCDEKAFNLYSMLIHRLVEENGGYKVRAVAENSIICDIVAHVPQMLFHCENTAEMHKFLPTEKPDISDGCVSEEIEKLLKNERRGSMPFVSVIIPSKDNPKLLQGCITVLKNTLRSDMLCEIIVVDNGSNADNRAYIQKMLKYEQCGGVITEYIYDEREFNFSYMCNLGAEHAKGEFLLFLNDDVELCLTDTILVMAALASREHTGAVGIKLYYPSTITIQHAGITNLPMGPVHKLQFKDDNMCYYHGINYGRRNVSAVTGACLMVEKSKFTKASGFYEQLKVAFNDVDFCFELLERGYYNVCLNDIYAYHHESLSRGNDETTEKLNRLLIEKKTLYERHPRLEGVDIYYPEGLGRDGLDTGVRPEYETARNDVTEGSMEAANGLTNMRRDECLMARIESCSEGIIQGYAVVLSDDNACYAKRLILADMQNENMIYAITLSGQYRPDLVENMPDQTNVGLCGFKVKPDVGSLNNGKYRVGVTAVNRVTGMGLYNFSNRFFEVKQSE
jgi:GT2 family glycosyltransferase